MISIIIPCYNHGVYLEECLSSVWAQTFRDYEVIIVNDGSTDTFTNDFLANYSHPSVRIISTANQGLASARNNGIQIAQGKYILPLDADDKISSDYLEKAFSALENDPSVGILYSNAEYFDGQEGAWPLPEYRVEEMLCHNVIFCSGVFRKKDWSAIGGYSTNLPMGNEDWDFWLKILALGREVYKIPEVCFYYRVKKDSMVKGINYEVSAENSLKVFFNNHDLYMKELGKYPHWRYKQFFVDSGRGFLQEKSICKPYWSDIPVTRFELSEYVEVKTLRFDPVNDYARIKFPKVTLILDDDSEHVVDNLECSSSSKVGAEILFASDDPQVFFDVPAQWQKRLKAVEFDIKVVEFGRDIVEKIKSDVEKENESLITTLAIKGRDLATKDRDLANKDAKLEFLKLLSGSGVELKEIFVSNLQFEKNKWVCLSDDPQVVLELVRPLSRVFIQSDILVDCMDSCIYYSSDGEFSVDRCILLNNKDLKRGMCLNLPIDAKFLRFDPIEDDSGFVWSSFELRSLGLWDAVSLRLCNFFHRNLKNG